MRLIRELVFVASVTCAVNWLIWRTAPVYAQPPAPPGPAQIATGTITILVDGKPINTAGVINIRSGSGVMAMAVPNPALSGTDILYDTNTAYAATLDTVHNNIQFCNSVNGTSAFTCKMPSRKLPVYQNGQVFLLVTDQSCTSCSLNIDDLGPKGIKDSLSNDAPITKATPRWVYYDGVVFRVV